MKLSSATSWILSIVSASVVGSSYAQDEVAGMTKMCLFYPNPSGHARSDPILNQVCPADHVHTFYGELYCGWHGWCIVMQSSVVSEL